MGAKQMVREADNDNELAAAKGMDGQGAIEFISIRLRGRADLFEMAIVTKKAMLETQAKLMQLGSQRELSAARTERRLIDREIHGMVSMYRKAGMRLMAIEDAMKPDMRVKFWQLVDTEDAWK
jgi:hypothetical protein